MLYQLLQSFARNDTSAIWQCNVLHCLYLVYIYSIEVLWPISPIPSTTKSTPLGFIKNLLTEGEGWIWNLRLIPFMPYHQSVQCSLCVLNSNRRSPFPHTCKHLQWNLFTTATLGQSLLAIVEGWLLLRGKNNLLTETKICRRSRKVTVFWRWPLV